MKNTAKSAVALRRQKNEGVTRILQNSETLYVLCPKSLRPRLLSDLRRHRPRIRALRKLYCPERLLLRSLRIGEAAQNPLSRLALQVTESTKPQAGCVGCPKIGETVEKLRRDEDTSVDQWFFSRTGLIPLVVSSGSVPPYLYSPLIPRPAFGGGVAAAQGISLGVSNSGQWQPTRTAR